MPWFKVDDGFHNHPKIEAVGNAAAGLFVRLGSYCSQQLTDGFVPESTAKRYGSATQYARLSSANLIRKVEGGWQIPDYLDFNPSREELQRKRTETAERQARWRESKRTEEGSGRRVTNTAPSHPIPSHLPKGCTESSSQPPPAPPDDDDFHRTLELILNAKQSAHPPHTNPKRWRIVTRSNTIAEDGELIQRMLHDGDQPETVALFVLGHGMEANRSAPPIPWCATDCPECDGDSWIHADNGLAPCPRRTG